LIELNLSNQDGFLRNWNITKTFIKNGLGPYLCKHDCFLNYLNIFGCCIGIQGLYELVPALKKNKSLLVLNIGNNLLNGDLSARKIVTILNSCKNLLELDISENLLKSKGASQIITALCEVNKEQ